jgi:hypothetical protein
VTGWHIIKITNDSIILLKTTSHQCNHTNTLFLIPRSKVSHNVLEKVARIFARGKAIFEGCDGES